MKWLKRIAFAVVAVIALLLVIGLLLPSGFKVQRSVQVAAPASKIYPLIVDPRQWKQWTVWNRRDPAMQMSVCRRGKRGRGQMDVAEQDRRQRRDGIHRRGAQRTP